QGTVTHHRYNLVGFSLEVPCRGHAERRRHGSAGVARAELIVLALTALQKSRDPLGLTEAREDLIAAGEELPGVRLVAHVPDDFVDGRFKLVEKRDAQLDDAKAGADVPARDRAALDETVPDLLSQLGELVPAEALEIFW